MFDISDERFSELVQNLHVWESIPDHGSISLELGKRDGLKTGYPQLSLRQIEEEYYLLVIIPSPSDPGYDTRREMTLLEMVIFVRVAKKKAPDSRMTKELIRIVRQHIQSKQTEYSLALELIS